MRFKCEQCGACCKLAWVHKGTKHELPLKEDGSCLNLIEKDGKYECSVYNDRPEICTAKFVKKELGLTTDEHAKLANKSRILLRKIVR